VHKASTGDVPEHESVEGDKPEPRKLAPRPLEGDLVTPFVSSRQSAPRLGGLTPYGMAEEFVAVALATQRFEPVASWSQPVCKNMCKVRYERSANFTVEVHTP
jgi:hypothetical protein